MEMVRKLNNFFFLVEGEDEGLHLSDGLWFYGGLALMVLIPVLTTIICKWGNI